ncbi:MAG: protein-disulfide reductase, partial [Rhodoferax sp.]|nr:protein-disulfide reductase [Rhodoferax sp.]
MTRRHAFATFPRLTWAALSFTSAMCCMPVAMAQGAPKAAVATVTTPQVRAELMANAPNGVGPGEPVWVGLQITHQPEWHTYWKNSGDSGLPTQLSWT